MMGIALLLNLAFFETSKVHKNPHFGTRNKIQVVFVL